MKLFYIYIGYFFKREEFVLEFIYKYYFLLGSFIIIFFKVNFIFGMVWFLFSFFVILQVILECKVLEKDYIYKFIFSVLFLDVFCVLGIGCYFLVIANLELCRVGVIEGLVFCFYFFTYVIDSFFLEGFPIVVILFYLEVIVL